ncbi:MAG: hypothetical protein GX345_07505 [Clostridiales bacterium]|nr:hypothetical protein [Clostridiales bacterium]
MTDIYTVLAGILKGMEPALKDCRMELIYPPGVKRDELPALKQGSKISIDFAGQEVAGRLEFFDNKIALLYSEQGQEGGDAAYTQLALSLLEMENFDDKDIKYIVNEFSESLRESVGGKSKASVKMPTPVSKSAARSGILAYDPNTLASRLTGVYPELKEAYRENVELFGDFLAEDFFLNHANAFIIETIRVNDKQRMRRLFNLLNEVYEDGTNETQGVIAVTILGALDNDQELLANCVDYMGQDLMGPVLQVNKYLASKSGKGSKMRLENPPLYKPKKKRGKNPISAALGL